MNYYDMMDSLRSQYGQYAVIDGVIKGKVTPFEYLAVFVANNYGPDSDLEYVYQTNLHHIAQFKEYTFKIKQWQIIFRTRYLTEQKYARRRNI